MHRQWLHKQLPTPANRKSGQAATTPSYILNKTNMGELVKDRDYLKCDYNPFKGARATGVILVSRYMAKKYGLTEAAKKLFKQGKIYKV